MSKDDTRSELARLYEGLTQEFLARIRRVSLFLRHPFLEGAAHENILREFLRSYLPEPLGVSRGAIWDARQQVSSGECDILIYDRQFPVAFRETDFVVVLPEAALAVIEVKTVLPQSGKEWQGVIAKVRQVQKASSRRNEGKLATFLFAFTARKQLLEGTSFLLGRALAPIVSKDLPMVTCVLGRSALLNKAYLSSNLEGQDRVGLFLYKTKQDTPKGEYIAPEPFIVFFALLLREIERGNLQGVMRLGQSIDQLMDALGDRIEEEGQVFFEVR
jgi:hypothetical protein